MDTAKATYNYISDYIIEVRSKGRFTLSLNELRSKFNVSEKALLQNIYRLKSKNEIAQVRKEFYVIIPPQYSNRGMVPTSLFIDDLMKFLNKDYYVGLLSAAALQGAGHQQPMGFQVISQKPALRKIKNKKLNINFFTKNHWQSDFIREKKTEAGYIKISSPELTAFDLVQYSKKTGGLNRILPILEELSEEMKPSFLVKVAKTQKAPCIQRLGYIFDVLEEESLANALYKIIKPVGLKKIPLSLSHVERKGEVSRKWSVVVNIELEY